MVVLAVDTTVVVVVDEKCCELLLKSEKGGTYLTFKK